MNGFIEFVNTSTHLLTYLLGVFAHFTVLFIIFRNVIPKWLGRRLRPWDIMSYGISVLLVILSIEYTPMLIAQAVNRSYGLAMPHIIETIDTITTDLREAADGDYPEFTIEDLPVKEERDQWNNLPPTPCYGCDNSK